MLVNNDAHGNYDEATEINFNTTKLRSSLYYSDAYILAKGAITVVGQGEDDVAIAAGRNNKQ